jgi:hypothetical protein
MRDHFLHEEFGPPVAVEVVPASPEPFPPTPEPALDPEEVRGALGETYLERLARQRREEAHPDPLPPNPAHAFEPAPELFERQPEPPVQHRVEEVTEVRIVRSPGKRTRVLRPDGRSINSKFKSAEERAAALSQKARKIAAARRLRRAEERRQAALGGGKA